MQLFNPSFVKKRATEIHVITNVKLCLSPMETYMEPNIELIEEKFGEHAALVARVGKRGVCARG